MINRGGEKIYSLEVENVIADNPKVMEVAVVGVQDKVMGEAVKACVVLKPGETATEEEIRQCCAGASQTTRCRSLWNFWRRCREIPRVK